MLQAKIISHTHRHQSGVTLQFSNLDIEINRGEIVCIIGKSGVGKSTLMKILSGLIPPDQGNVTCDGKPLTQPLSPVALVFQDYQNAVFRWLTVKQNLTLGRHKGYEDNIGHFSIDDVASELGIDALLKEYPSKLSGGQIQRVQIGRALVTDVDYLLLDEPDSSVDLEFKQDLQRILINLAINKNIGIVLVSHSIDQAVFLAHRIYILKSFTPPSVETIELNGFKHKIEFVKAREETTFQELYKCVHTHLFE